MHDINTYESGIEPDEALDAMTAAPDHHRVIFENEHVRVLDARIKPGETVPVHTHRWPSIVYALSTSEFIRYDVNGNALLDSRTANAEIEIDSVISQPPLPPHSIENVGDSEIRAINIELKN